MLRYLLINLLFAISFHAYAESPCDIRTGTSIGIRVVEFFSGHLIYSKMPFKQSTAAALIEEMINLQEMGICEEKINSPKCILKYEKRSTGNVLVMYRGPNRWNTWSLKTKVQAQNYVKDMKEVGFCS